MQTHARLFPAIALVVTLAFSMMACGDILSPAQTVTSVLVGDQTQTVARGGTHTFNATVVGTNTPPQAVFWTIDEAGRHPQTTIGRYNGVLNVAVDETLETLTVRATSAFNTAISGVATVTIPVPTVYSVTVDGPATVDIERGGTQVFTATVIGTNSPPQTVTWSIVETGISSQTTIGPDNGLLAVATDENLTRLTIRATSTFNPEVSEIVNVNVTPPTGIPTVTGVVVTPGIISIERNGTYTFVATVTGNNAPEQTVTWSIVETGRHTQTTIGTDSGVLRIAADEGLARLTIRATSTLNPEVSGTAIVTVTAYIPSHYPTVTSVTIDPATVEVARGGTRSFTATVIGTNNPLQTVTWSIVETGRHVQTTIGTDGLLRVAAAESLATLTIRATSTVNPAVSETATVTVVIPTVTAVTVDGPATVARGWTHPFTATVDGTNSPPQTVTWSIVEAGRHAQTTIGPDGVLSVAADESLATLTIQATSTFNTAISGTRSVIVTTPTVTSVTVDGPGTVARGVTHPFTAMVVGTNSPPQDVTWSIDEADRHTQTTIGRYNGVLNVAAAESLTTLTIRATSMFDITISGMRSVTVTIPTVTNVTVNPANITIARGVTHTFTATVVGTNDPPQTVTWSIVGTGRHAQTTIGTDGVLSVAAAESLTTLTIQATSTFNPGVSGTATVTVTGHGNGASPVTHIERVMLENGAYAIFRFDLPPNTSWADFHKITADYMVDAVNLARPQRGGNQVRLMGNYSRESDFVLMGDGIRNFSLATGQNSSNAPFIIDNTPRTFANMGAVANQWFTVTYNISGAAAHDLFYRANIPAATATGPFFFGVGIPGDGFGIAGGITQYIRNVTLHHRTNPALNVISHGSGFAEPTFVSFDPVESTREIITSYGPTVPGTGNFTVSFGPNIETDIVGPTISLLGLGVHPQEVNITVLNPERYDSIRWFFDRGGIWGPETLTLNSNIHDNRLGTHFVTVVVIRDGVSHSKRISFTVVP